MSREQYPTFSYVELAFSCPYPWSGVHEWPERARSSYAEFGGAVSDVAECLAVWGDAPVDSIADAHQLSSTDRRRLRLAKDHLSEHLASCDHQWRKPETALAYSPTSGKAWEIGGKGRDYSNASDTDLCGTPDLVACTSSGQLIVTDWKTGQYKRGHRPIDTPQLRALGLAAARCYGHDSVLLQLVQVDDDGLIITEDLVGPWEFNETAYQLREMVALIDAVPSIPRPGHWCRSCYCPIVAECPATHRALEAALNATQLRFPLTTEIEGPDHAVYLRERIGAAKLALETLGHAVDRFARKTPFPTREGHIYGLRESSSERIDLGVPGALECIREALGGDADDALDFKTSKAAIRRALKGKVANGDVAGTMRVIMAELTGLGAVRVSTSARYEEFKVQPQENENV